MTRFFYFLFFTTAIITYGTSCNETEIGNSEDVNQDAIYFDYHVSADEENSTAVVRLRYRFGGPNGTTLLLNSPSVASLNGKALTADSTKYEGVYYEAAIPLIDFTGEQKISFITTDNKEYENAFVFSPFFIKDSLPQTIRQDEDFILQFDGLQSRDHISFILTDTAFSSREIHRTDTLQDGRLVVLREELARLAPGPLTLEVYREEITPLEKTTPEGGKLVKVYTLRKSLQLITPASR